MHLAVRCKAVEPSAGSAEPLLKVRDAVAARAPGAGGRRDKSGGGGVWASAGEERGEEDGARSEGLGASEASGSGTEGEDQGRALKRADDKRWAGVRSARPCAHGGGPFRGADVPSSPHIGVQLPRAHVQAKNQPVGKGRAGRGRGGAGTRRRRGCCAWRAPQWPPLCGLWGWCCGRARSGGGRVWARPSRRFWRPARRCARRRRGQRGFRGGRPRRHQHGRGDGGRR
jgi:hypothetical protein